MNDEELIKVLIDLEKKGWAKKTEWGGWEITEKAKEMIEKYGKEKAMEMFSIIDVSDEQQDDELEVEFFPEDTVNRTLH